MIHATNGSSQAVHNNSAFDNTAKPASQPPASIGQGDGDLNVGVGLVRARARSTAPGRSDG